MLKLVWRGIVANLGRLALTLVSVVLGVAFVSGSFILADSLRSLFNQISEDAFAGVDAQIRAVEPEIESTSGAPVRFDQDVVEDTVAVDGVNYAEGGIFDFEKAFTLNEDGEVNRIQGPPVFTTSWSGPGPLSTFTLLDGSAPVGQQVALDKGQVDNGGFTLGDEVDVANPQGGVEQFTLSAIVQFGEEEGSAGAFYLLFDLPTTQRLLGAEGTIDYVGVSADPDVDSETLLADIGAILPAGLEVVSGETVVNEQQDEFNDFISIFGNILLGFAVVVLFVSTFIIYNTFAILVGQRTRQLGLLRSIGASRSQIQVMVMLEAVIIGLIASIVGLFGGLLVASALKTLFSQGGGSFPDGPLQILPRTIYVVVLVGLVVTVLSASLPAFRASRVSPLEAVRSGGRKERSTKYRIAIGAVVLVPGLILLGIGMFTDIDSTSTRLTAIGLGAALTFIGVSMMSALFAGPVASMLGAPIEAVKGVTGRIARDNASRNPQRTAATATALMIGLALITGVAVLTRSILVTFDALLEDSLTADLFVYEGDQGWLISASIVDDLRDLPETDLVAGLVPVGVLVEGEPTTIAALDIDTGTRVFNYGLVDGTTDLSNSGVAVYEPEAESRELTLGDQVAVTFEDGFETDLTVEAIYDNSSAVDGSWIIPRSLSSEHAQTDLVSVVGLTFPEGADFETNRAAVEQVTSEYPQVTVEDNSELQETVAGQISQLQTVIGGLLVLCLIVAMFGIVNTMTLSVLERTREIGLLRAVGMTRRQLRSTIRWDAVIVSMFGSVLGVLMGLLLGWAAVIAIPDEFVSKVGIPWGQVATYLIGGGLIGVIASYLPARRAGRMNVLDAISHE